MKKGEEQIKFIWKDKCVWIYFPTRNHRIATISTSMYSTIPTILIGLNKCSNKIFSLCESVK